MKLMRLFKYLHSGLMGDFMVNVYATSFGVLLSLLTADLVSTYYRERDIKAMMSILLDELDGNLEKVDAICDRIQLEKRGCRYLYGNRHSFGAIPQDSLALYGMLPFTSQIFYFTSDGFEALKASGLLAKVSDHKVVLSVIKAYAAQGDIEKNYKSYLERKSIYRSELIHHPKLQDMESISLSSWKTLFQLKETQTLLRDLPMYQSSSMYLKKRELLVDAIEYIRCSYQLE